MQDDETIDDVQDLTVHTGGRSDRWVIDPAPDSFDVPLEEVQIPQPIKKRLEKQITGSEEARSKAKHEGEDDAPNAYYYFDVVEPRFRLEHLLKLYEQSSVHYAAVQAKVSNIVGLGYELADSQATRDKLDQMDDDSEEVQRFRRSLQRAKFRVFAMLDELNSEADFDDTLQRIAVDYEVFGNCYIEVGRKANGQIGYVGHLPASTMRVRRTRDGFLQMVDKKPVFFRNFGDTETADPIRGDSQPNEVIHLKKYHPSSTYYGVPDIVAALTELAGNKFAADFNLEYFENKAIPKYIMTVHGKKVNVRTQNNMFDFFEANFKGKHHRLLIVPVDTTDNNAKVEFQPIEAGVQDSSFNTYYKSNIDGILMAHRVPITKVGMAEGVNVALAKDADKTFKEQVCHPIQRSFEKKLNKILSNFTNAFRFKLVELTLTDEIDQSKIDETYLRSGVIVPNEIRSGRWGWPGVEWGDDPVPLSPQGKADAEANDNQTRERDSQRRRARVDESGGARQPKGEGRASA